MYASNITAGHESRASVILQEAAGLVALANSLDARFDEAVRQIVGTTGRVVVAGIGKSGHVARKIAATLSATGTAAFFVHAAEAAHGDLGMLRAHDTVLALSNSGTTPELIPLIAHVRRIGAHMIAISSNPDSLLMQRADIGLRLPAVREACPQHIAPTTSTTMMLALGDALAIAAMQMRGVSRADLMQWHPGGAIGGRALPVESLLRPQDPLPLVTPETGMRDVVLEMTSSGKGAAGVVDREGHLIGVITDGDLRRAFNRMLIATAGEVMTPTPITVPAGTEMEAAAALCHDAKINIVFVMDAANPRKPIGLLHIHDLSISG